jgi:16S rRNA (guanine966-N2)-methyltransferase
MRIIGGKLKGRVLAGPASAAIRPTSDRLRETIFNILAHGYGDRVEGVRVLDLFTGTGAMAIEALSRGASYALLVDKSTEALALAHANLESLGLSGSARVLRRDAIRLGAAPPGGRFDLGFLDPPYGKGLVGPTLEALRNADWLEPGALLVVEEAKSAEIPLPDGFGLIEARTTTDTMVRFLRRE